MPPLAEALPPAPVAIVITGQALPEAKAEQVYAVERISTRQIEQSPTHELDELLKDVPGVQLFRRSDSRSGHPTSQGVTLRALGGNASSRALLVLDGVPQSDPFGGWINWPAYDPGDLSGIRVVRGGGSVANGPGALAGTIEMSSRSDAAVAGEVDAGSRDSIELQSACRDRRCRWKPRLVRAGGAKRWFRPDHPSHSRSGRPASTIPAMEQPRPLGGSARPVDRDAGERLRVSRLADSRDRVQHRPDQRGGRIASVGRSRRVAMERARLLAVAQPAQQHRKPQRRENRRHPSAASGRRAVARPRRQCRNSSAHAGRIRASDRGGRASYDGRDFANFQTTARASPLAAGARAARPSPVGSLPKAPPIFTGSH